MDSAAADTPQLPDASAGRPAPGSTREFLTVAIPLVLSAGSLAIMNVIDRMLLTWYSTDALAAALPAGMLHWTIMSIPIGMVLYVNTFVAQYDGAGRPDRVVASVWHGALIAVATGIAVLAFIPLAPAMLGSAGHSEAIFTLEVDYFTTLCWGSVAYTLANALSCFYTGRQSTQVVMWVNVLSVLVNFVVDYLLIFGRGPFPELGIRGAAWGTIAARVVAVVAYVGLLILSGDRSRYNFRVRPVFDRELFARLLKFGVPNGMHFFIDVFGFTVFVFLIGNLGAQELAATSLAFNLNALAFIPLFGFGMAVSTLVGHRVGEGRPELGARTTWVAFSIAAVWMLMFAAAFIIAPDFVLGIYAMHNSTVDFAAVRDHVVVLLRFVAAYSFFDAMSVVFSSAVRGAGDTRFPMLISFVCCWLIMVVPTAVMNARGGDLLWSWSACTAYIVVVGFAMLARFLQGRWRTMKVIESESESDAVEPAAGADAGAEHAVV